jgi:hypothetical protein
MLANVLAIIPLNPPVTVTAKAYPIFHKVPASRIITPIQLMVDVHPMKGNRLLHTAPLTGAAIAFVASAYPLFAAAALIPSVPLRIVCPSSPATRIFAAIDLLKAGE